METKPEKRIVILDGIECEIVSISATEVCYKRADKPSQAYIIPCLPSVLVEIDEENNEVVSYEITDEEIIDAYNAPRPEPEKRLDTKLYAVYSQLPVEVRAVFAPAWVIVNEAIQLGDYELAIFTIKNAQVPTELQPYKDNLLSMFGG